jgi:hypothetical protein
MVKAPCCLLGAMAERLGGAVKSKAAHCRVTCSFQNQDFKFVLVIIRQSENLFRHRSSIGGICDTKNDESINGTRLKISYEFAL